MMKKAIILLLLPLTVLAAENFTVRTIDFLAKNHWQYNAAGPLMVQVDPDRNRILLANTLTSSFSIIDGGTHAVTNIPIAGRVLQHLKSDAMTWNRLTGDIWVIGTNGIHMIAPQAQQARFIPTPTQLEAIAVDQRTGNVYLAGRQSQYLFFFNARTQKLKRLNWLEREERLINLNATPPPPIRKVIAASELGQVIAVDGYTSTVYLFDAAAGRPLKSFSVPLTSGGRWHLAGYNEHNHCLYLVVERDNRQVLQAGQIDIANEKCLTVALPGLTEAAGVTYHPQRDEVYIPYDNHALVHVVDFKHGGEVAEIKLPTYGNDASALDLKKNLLYIGSWNFGEIDMVDLQSRRLVKRMTHVEILPHTFSMAFNPHTNLLYIPKGATAVNGSFGSAIWVVDPVTESYEKISTGWAPIDLVEMPARGSFLVFNSEDEMAEVRPEGQVDSYRLPNDYPLQAIAHPNGDVYLSYGPHQSYWPVVYIWDARDGILTIRANDLSFYDRRIPRQAHRLAFDKNGVLYFTQNNWGGEEQFLGRLEDEVRLFDIGRRLALGDQVLRETTQRLLQYDPERHRLYLVRIGEQDSDPSILQIIDLDSQRVLQKVPLGLTATDLAVAETEIVISNFESNTVSIVDKNSFGVREIATGAGPLKLALLRGRAYVINHLDHSLQELSTHGKRYPLPFNGFPDNLFVWRERLVIAAHSDQELALTIFDPITEKFSTFHRHKYPYGDTRFDSRNVSFYANGQFGDAIFAITQGKVDQQGRLWITDFLSGKLFIIF
jgi:DNA-binding beta-propeller fold protein YncE